MDDDVRRDLMAAAFDQLPLPAALTEGPEQRLVAMNRLARRVVGDHPVGTPLTGWTDVVGRQGAEWTVPLAESEASVHLSVVSPAGPRDDVLAALQDAMLPKGLPVLQGVELAARYLLAESYAGSGGDWFDAIPLPDGRVAAVVGDVVGHGVEASVVMGELKALFDERVRHDGDVVAALELLDRRASRLAQARATTVCVCVLDPESGELSYCTAGHPPPVVVSRDGQARYLPLSGGRPLGSGPPFATARDSLGEGEVLLLYSDGLVERPGRDPAQNAVDLLRVAGDVVRGVGPVSPRYDEAPVDRVCRQVLELLPRVTGYADDITVLALQRVPEVEALRLAVPATPDSVRTVRAGLDDWLDGLHASALDEMALRHSVAELVSNAVQHAYAEPGGTDQVRIDVGLDGAGVLDVRVVDDGSWRDPAEAPVFGARGLAMVRGFVDHFRLEHDEHGTRAHLRHRLSHPASMLRGASSRAERADRDFDLSVDGQQVSVRGAVDREGATLLRRTLDRASRGGARTVSVDLSGVDLLSSAGVRVLLDASAGGEVQLVAPVGSAAQRVLDLVHLPYVS